MAKKPVIFFLGKSGSGKDTQAEILIKKFGFNFISTGQLLRDFKNQGPNFPEGSLERYEAEGIKRILEAGKFVPTLTVACQWRFAALEVMRNFNKSSGLVFGGSPRKLAEAMILDDLFLHWPEAEHFSIKPIELVISDEEAKKRLLLRGREDDNDEAIKNRLGEFQEFVVPVIDYFKKSERLLAVNGDKSVDDVHKDVLKVLELHDY